jgi:hypothetical protein
MDSIELAERSVAELWTLRAVVVDILSRKILAEKATLEERLRKISLLHDVEQKRRPYPEVLPKYRNPKNPNETWFGSRQATSVAHGTAPIRQEARSFPYPAIRIGAKQLVCCRLSAFYLRPQHLELFG